MRVSRDGRNVEAAYGTAARRARRVRLKAQARASPARMYARIETADLLRVSRHEEVVLRRTVELDDLRRGRCKRSRAGRIRQQCKRYEARKGCARPGVGRVTRHGARGSD